MTKKTSIKIGIVIVIICVMGFSDWSFAVDTSKLELMNEISKLLHIAVSILSWIWVLFAQGAGEFLTNKWVYGEVIGLDAILWKYWNVIKNIANFCLGFYFIYLIFSALLDSGDVIGKIKKQIGYILVAGIGIQSSWFLTAVVLDLSTITLATAGAFPSLVVSEVKEADKALEETFSDYFYGIKGPIDEIKSGMTFSLFSPDMGESNFITLKREIPLQEKMTKKELYDTIMPNADNVSGPLYYLGFSILRVTTIISPSSSDNKGWLSTIFNTLLQGGTTIVFSIEMFVLLLIAIIRLLYMWVFIVLSPIVVLIECIKRSGSKLGKDSKLLDELTKHFNLKSFFWNAFKPALIVLCISVTMIFSSLISKEILSSGDKELDVEGMKHSRNIGNDPKNGNDGDKQYTTIMDGDLAEISINKAGKAIFDFILSVVTVVLIYIIIRFAVTMGGGNDFVSEKIKNIQKNVDAGIGSIPLVPVSGWDKNGNKETHYLSAGRAFGFGTFDNKENTRNLLEAKIDTRQSSLEKEEASQTDALNNLLGRNNPTKMSDTDWNAITSAGKSENLKGLSLLEAKRKIIKSKKTPAGRGFILDPTKGDSRWRDEFENWLKNTEESQIPSSFDGVSSTNIGVWKEMVRSWKENKYKSLKEMFSDGEFGRRAVKAYAEFFGYKDIESWLKLQEIDISKSDEESGENSGEGSEGNSKGESEEKSE